MDRNTARTLALALLCVLALVVAAATLTSMETGGAGDGGGFSGGSGADGPDGPDGAADRPQGDANRSGGALPQTCVEPLASTGGVAAVALVALGALILVGRRFGVGVAVVVALALAPLAILGALILTGGCTTAAQSTAGPINGTLDNGSGGGGGGGDLFGDGGTDGDVPAVALPTLALLSVLLIAIGGAALALLYSGTSSRDAGGARSEPEDDEERREEVGRAAGRAADRIEDADDFENEVYRAWREMADALPIDRPSSSTPGEFAGAARDVGIDDEEVAELTALFEDVRYGGREATAEREERAVAALRRIEASYGGDGDG